MEKKYMIDWTDGNWGIFDGEKLVNYHHNYEKACAIRDVLNDKTLDALQKDNRIRSINGGLIGE